MIKIRDDETDHKQCQWRTEGDQGKMTESGYRNNITLKILEQLSQMMAQNWIPSWIVSATAALKKLKQRGSVNKAQFVTQPNLLISPHN